MTTMLLSEELEQAQDHQCDTRACFECGFFGTGNVCLISRVIRFLQEHQQ